MVKTAFVTGATRGIGRATAAALAKAGWRVIGMGRDRRVLADLRADHGVEPLALDLTDRRDLTGLTKDLRIDALVHAALRWPNPNSFLALNEAEIDMTLEVNLSAALHLTQAVVRSMRTEEGGAVLFLVPDVEPSAGVLETTISGALQSFARSLSAETGKCGIAVDCLPIGQPPFEATAQRAVAIVRDRLEAQRSVRAEPTAEHP